MRWKRSMSLAVCALVAAAAIGDENAPQAETQSSRSPIELSAPIKLLANAQPIDTPPFGHAAPFVGDFDGDGVNDLLVGEFAEGQLRIYRNLGSNAEPRLAPFVRFMGGAAEGRIPSG